MEVIIVKIGGNIIDDSAKLRAFLKEFARIDGKKILVHGGGKIATAIGKKLGIEPNYVEGRRITDAETLELITMVYGGLINKNIVATLQSFGCNAIGLTGADGAIMPAVKRPVTSVDYGFVGDIKSDNVNSYLFAQLIGTGLVPVIAPLSFDISCGLLNTNADTMAQEIAKKMAQSMAVRLVYCFEKSGVLANVDDDSSVINSVTEKEFARMKQNGIISDGMIPKLENALAAVKAGVKKVIIGHADDLSSLINETAGTCIQ
jgi:acetylglutamate kinase